jgi:hypothetical protein
MNLFFIQQFLAFLCVIRLKLIHTLSRSKEDFDNSRNCSIDLFGFGNNWFDRNY